MDRTRLAWSLVTSLACGSGAAQDQTAARVALSIAAFDRLAAQCERGAGLTSAQRQQVDRWQSSQGVPALRAHLRGSMPSGQQREVDAAADSVVRQVLPGLGNDACAAADRLTRAPDAQFASLAPELLAVSKAATVKAESARPRAAPPGKAQDLAAQIEGFAFDACATVGYGGMVLVSACPLVLLRNGDALKDVSGLAHPQGLAAHKAARAKDWTRWQRSGGSIQVQKADGWKNIAFNAIYPALPKDFRLDGSFRAMRGSGTQAIGGSQAVAAWTDLRFHGDGRVERGGGAGASESFGNSSVVSASKSAGRVGRYRIDGLTLAIRWDDGTSEHRLLIANPKDPKTAIWLDGEGYARRDRDRK